MQDVTIIDFGAGNLESLSNALKKVDIVPTITKDPKIIENASALILPGVGAFGDAISALNIQKSQIIDLVSQGRVVFGICLGMQILLSQSEEKGTHEGFSFIEGTVNRFPSSMKVPHMGWNQIKIQNKHPIVEEILKDAYFYFVHSYYCDPKDSRSVVATTDYSLEFASVVGNKNIIGTQFHPEKSGKAGLQILSNFKNILKQ